MTTNEQKKTELAHLKKAFNLLNIQNYSIVDQEGESPDFLIEICNQTKGVEVTDLYRKFSEGNAAKTQSDLPKIVKETIHIYNQKNGMPLTFSFYFNGKKAVNNRRETARKLGDYLYEYTQYHFPNGVESMEEISFDEPSSFPIITLITISPTNEAIASGITFSGFNSIPVTETIIKETIDKKEKLLPKYKQRCSEIWLLIVLPSMMLAGDFELQDEIIEISHSFETVYLLDNYRNEIKIIKNA